MHPAGRALIGFWAVLALLAGGGAVTLWLLGPPGAVKPVAPAQPRPPAATATTTVAGKPPASTTVARTGTAPASDPAVPAPIAALQEPAPDYPDHTLPIVGPDGLTPAEAYAAPSGPPAGGTRIAILLEGLGLSDAIDRDAVDTLPPQISFAVSPYSDAFDRPGSTPLLDQARHNGHELWLSLPMEPAGSPADGEGGRALSLNVDLADDRKALQWTLSRFPGYVGATNALGGLRGDRFASSSAFSLVAAELDRRGLLYLDAGLAPHDQPAINPPRTRHADLAIDESPDASDIQARLSRLEQIAQQKGSALGVAGPLRPATIERLRVWSRTLHERGISLVPVSALPMPPAPGDPHATGAPGVASPTIGTGVDRSGPGGQEGGGAPSQGVGAPAVAPPEPTDRTEPNRSFPRPS